MTPGQLVLFAYAPALKDHEPRALTILQQFEQALGLRLECTVSKDGSTPVLPQRDSWLLEHTIAGAVPLLCNGDTSFPVALFGLRDSGRSTPGATALALHAELPEAASTASAAIEALAESSHAFWAHATPFAVAAELSQQTQDPRLPLRRPPRGLPPLSFPTASDSPALPRRLGWLNYWSAAAAQALGFPDSARDSELLSRARRTASGGWVVQLTETPLNLDNPSHLDALLRAYERFPEIGGRVALRNS